MKRRMDGGSRRAIASIAVVALLLGVTAMADDTDPGTRAAGVTDGGGDEARTVSPASSTPLVDVGPTPGDREVDFELVLALPGEADLHAFVREVMERASATRRMFLSADEIGERFGLSDADLERIVNWAVEHGIVIRAVAPQRVAMTVGATAAAIEEAFDVTLHDFSDGSGRTFHAPTAVARVPPALEGLVAAIDGLDARPTERPALRNPIAAGPRGGMTPPIIDRAFELEPLRALGIHGEGQTVAIVSLDTFDPADVALFDRLAGTSGPRVERVAVSGGVASPGDDQDEVNLDIDVIRALAPKASIVDYEAPNRGGAIAAIVDRIVADGRADIVSISWGSCELSRTAESLARLARSLAAAAAAGITVFVASGDHGAYDCVDQDRRDLRIAVDSPASDVNVVGVGGTYASMREDGTYIDEAGWEEPLTGWGPGGGVSTVNRRPSWQTGAGVDDGRSNGMRQVPDVAGPADPDSGFLTVSAGEASSGGGTSAAAPFWAGYAALVRQLAAQEGIDGLGPLGPTLYAVAAAQPSGAVFHDVTRGGNLFDNARPGWDYATGLGTPRGAPLARAIVDHLKAR